MLELKANVANGVATLEEAEVRAPLHRIALTGAAPLGGGRLNLSGKTEPLHQATAGVIDPAALTTFLISGPWSALVVTPTAGLSAEVDAAWGKRVSLGLYAIAGVICWPWRVALSG